jgi:hypothetical protein
LVKQGTLIQLLIVLGYFGENEEVSEVDKQLFTLFDLVDIFLPLSMMITAYAEGRKDDSSANC